MLRVTSVSRAFSFALVAALSLGVLGGCDFSSVDQSGSNANVEAFNTTDASGAATHGMNIANRALRTSAPSNLRSKSGTSVQSEEALARTLDRELAYISEVVPGFGGMYLDDENGIMHVYVKNPGNGNGPSKGLTTAIQSASPKARFSALAKLQVYTDRGRIEIHDGEYSFDRLAEWKQDAMALFEGSSPVLSIDANEGENRVVVGVETATVPDRLRDRLAQIGVPEGAVKFETNQGPVTPLKDLRDKFRPLRGGIQIRLGSAFGSECTLGWDVHFQVDGQNIPGFLTNSHCTDDRTSVTGVAFYQGGNQVGTEAYEAKKTQNVQDPPHYFNYNSCHSVTRASSRTPREFSTKAESPANERLHRPRTGGIRV